LGDIPVDSFFDVFIEIQLPPGQQGNLFNTAIATTESSDPNPNRDSVITEVVVPGIDGSIADLGDVITSTSIQAVADKAEGASASLQTALDELDKDPPDNQAAVGNIEGAIGDLEAAVNEGLDPVLGAQLMDALTGIARQLAVDAIDEAIADPGSDPGEISDAQQSLADGDALRASGDYKDAANKYKDALSKAESALP